MAATKKITNSRWLEFDRTKVWNPATSTYGWIGLEPRLAWPSMNLNLTSPGFDLKRTINPPPPNPPLSIIALFGEAPSSPLYPMTSLVASRLAFHFGLYHFSVREHILSLAKSVESDPVGAYKAGSLGWLHPEALARYVNEDRIHEIPGKLLVGLVRKKIDALVAEGHRRFVMTDHPESIDAFTRFLGLQGERGISDVKCVVWLHDLTQASVISNDRKLAMKYFRATNREISVQVDGRSGDEVYGDLMRAFYQRVLAAGGGFVEEKGGEAMDADKEKEEIEGPKRVDSVRT